MDEVKLILKLKITDYEGLHNKLKELEQHGVELLEGETSIRLKVYASYKVPIHVYDLEQLVFHKDGTIEAEESYFSMPDEYSFVEFLKDHTEGEILIYDDYDEEPTIRGYEIKDRKVYRLYFEKKRGVEITTMLSHPQNKESVCENESCHHHQTGVVYFLLLKDDPSVKYWCGNCINEHKERVAVSPFD